MCVIRFGRERADQLTVHGRNTPGSDDYWDGNWLWCTAEVSAGAFRGTVDSVLRNEDLARFLPQLERLRQGADRGALLDTLDGWLDVRLEGGGGDEIEVLGQLCDNPVGGNALEFRLRLDRAHLPSLVDQVRAVVEAFPVVGQKPAGRTGQRSRAPTERLP